MAEIEKRQQKGGWLYKATGKAKRDAAEKEAAEATIKNIRWRGHEQLQAIAATRADELDQLHKRQDRQNRHLELKIRQARPAHIPEKAPQPFRARTTDDIIEQQQKRYARQQSRSRGPVPEPDVAAEILKQEKREEERQKWQQKREKTRQTPERGEGAWERLQGQQERHSRETGQDRGQEPPRTIEDEIERERERITRRREREREQEREPEPPEREKDQPKTLEDEIEQERARIAARRARARERDFDMDR